MKKNLLKKGTSLLLTLAMLCGLLVPSAFAAGDHAYSDIHGIYAEDAIERWSDYGIIQGNHGKFNPGDPLTRGQMAAILSRLLVLPEAEDAGFKDLEGEWAADYINRCAAAGIMLGSDGYANPGEPISRQQAVVMLARALGIEPVKSADLSMYTDAAQVADYAAGYVAAMAQAGIVKGTTDKTLSPYANITRAATVTILDRAIEVYANEAGEEYEAEGTGLVLVVANKTKINAAKGTTVIIADGVTGTRVNGKAVTGGQTYVTKSDALSGGGGGGSSSGGGSSAEDLTITESSTHTEGVYGDVIITDAVGDGEVTLTDLTIEGDLTINGGGSNTVKLVRCTILGKIIVTKEGGETPRVHLTATPVKQVEAKQPAIIEAADTKSPVGEVKAEADVHVKGMTDVEKVTVSAPAEAPAPTVAVSGNASVESVEAKTPATVAPEKGASVGKVKAEADVTIPSGAVPEVEVPATAEKVIVHVGKGAAVGHVHANGQVTHVHANGEVGNVTAAGNVTVEEGTVGSVTVPETAPEQVEVKVEAEAEVKDVTVNKPTGTTVTNNGTVGGMSSALEETPVVTPAGSNAIPSHFHKWDEGKVTVHATCTENGVLTYTCVAGDCDATRTNVILASGHAWTESWVVEGDRHVRYCENDAAHKLVADHSWSKGVITTAPTCEVAGVKTSTCVECAAETTEVVAAIGHKWSDGWTYVDETNHERVCANDATHKEVVAHTVVVDAAKAPTCSEVGLSEGSHCGVCGGTIVEQKEVPALGHDFTGDYSYDESGHWHVCSRCDETDDKENHTFDTKDCAKDAKCTVCAYVKPAGQHSWDDGDVTTEPTCTEAGVMTYTCYICGTTDTKPIDALGHDPVTDEAVEPDCEDTGLTEGSHCARCDTVLVKQDVVPALGHVEVVVPGTPATCESRGWTDGKECDRCGETLVEQERIPALGHDFTGKYASDENGHWHVCSRCGETDRVSAHTFNNTNCAEAATCTVCAYVKPAGQHTWDEGYVFAEGTCTDNGTIRYTCESCGETHDEKTPPKGHIVVGVDAVEPTCTESGLTAGEKCYVCGVFTKEQEVIPALGHVEVIDKGYDATCTESGLTEGKHCDRCDEVLVEQKPIDALGHAYSDKYASNENGHWHVCERCGETDRVNAHTFNTTNCAEAAACTECGYTKPAGDHTWNRGEIVTRPTCETEGKRIYTCESCGKEKDEPIAALGHSWGDWTSLNEKEHQRVCANDADHVETAPHNFDGASCADCGYGKSLSGRIFIRHQMEELGFVNDALQVVDGEVQITVPGYGTATVGEAMPEPAMREGWTYTGWNLIVQTADGTEIFRQSNVTEFTPDLESVLLSALENGYNVFMDASRGDVMGDNGFGLAVYEMDGELMLELQTPAGEDDDVYYVDVLSTDRAESYSCSFWKDEDSGAYLDSVWALLPAAGVYRHYEVRDEDDNLLAVSYFDGFTAIMDIYPLDDQGVPVLSINYAESTQDTIVYEITIPTYVGLTYQVADLDEDGQGDVYFLGYPDHGRLTLETDVAEPLNDEVVLYGVEVGEYNGNRTYDIYKPLTLTVPAFDPDQLGPGGGGSSIPMYHPYNVRFEDQYLKWNAPLIANDEHVEYQIRVSANGGTSWIDNVGTDNTQVAYYCFDPGMYDKVVVEAWVDDEMVGFTKADIYLANMQNPDKAAPDSVTVERLTEKDKWGTSYQFYRMTATGLTPYTSHIFSVMDLAENWNNRDFHEVVSDANGVAYADFGLNPMVETGYYSIIELEDYSLADEFTTKAYWAYLGGIEKCMPSTNEVWFEEDGRGYMSLHWNWEPMADMADYNRLRVDVHNADEGFWTTLDDTRVGESEVFVNNPGVAPGVYDEMRVVALKVDEFDQIVEKTNWFSTPIDLEIYSYPNNAPVLDSMELLDNGEYQLNIGNLWGQMNSSVEVMTSMYAEYRECYGQTFPTGGYGMAVLTTNWPTVPGGYYHLREYVDMYAHGTSATFYIREGEWTKFVDDGSGDAVTGTVEFVNDNGYLAMTWDAKKPSDISNYNRYVVYLHSTLFDDWRLLDIMQFSEGEVRFFDNDRFEPLEYDQVRVDLAKVDEWGQFDGTERTWFTADIDLTMTVEDSYANVEFEKYNNYGDYTVTITDLSGEICKLTVADADDMGEYNNDVFSVDNVDPYQFNRPLEFVDNNGVYQILEYTLSNVSGNQAHMNIWDSGWHAAVSTGSGSADAVSAPKGIVSMQQSGFTIKMGMEAPDDMSNIDYFSLSLYDSADREDTMMTGITCSKDHPYFYVSKDEFDPDVTYDTVEITAHALNGYEDAVWMDEICVNHQDNSRDITYTYDVNNKPDPLLTVNFNKATPGFYRIDIYDDDQLIANDSSYSWSSDSGMQISRSCIAEEQAAINAGTATVQVSGWNVVRLDDADGYWTVDISTYDAECAIAAPGGSDDEVASGEVMFQISGNNVIASWADYGYSQYCLKFMDENGQQAGITWSNNENPQQSDGLFASIPRPAELGTSSYTLEVYGADGNFNIRSKVAESAPGALEITVSGDALDYEVSYNDPETDQHTVTIANAPSGEGYLRTWYRPDGSISRCGWHGSLRPSMQMYHPVSDGDVFDLRAIFSYSVSDDAFVIEMTPPSTVEYEASDEANDSDFPYTDGTRIIVPYTIQVYGEDNEMPMLDFNYTGGAEDPSQTIQEVRFIWYVNGEEVKKSVTGNIGGYGAALLHTYAVLQSGANELELNVMCYPTEEAAAAGIGKNHIHETVDIYVNEIGSLDMSGFEATVTYAMNEFGEQDAYLTISGLVAGTRYDFQVYSADGELDGDVFTASGSEIKLRLNPERMNELETFRLDIVEFSKTADGYEVNRQMGEEKEIIFA